MMLPSSIRNSFETALVIGLTCFAAISVLGRQASAEEGVFLSVGTDRNISKISRLQYLPKSDQAFTVTADKCVRLWDVNGWKKLDEFRFHIGSGRVGEITSLASSKDESTFAVGRFGRKGTADGDILIVQKSPRKIVRRLLRHQASVTHLVFYDDDKKLISVDESGLLLLWDLQTGKIISNATFKQANEKITSVSLNKQNKLVLGTSTGNLHLLNVAPLKVLKSIKRAHSKMIKVAAWTNADELVSLGDEGDLNLWKLKSGSLQRIKQKKLGDRNNLITLTMDRKKKEIYAFFGADENKAEATVADIACRVFGYDINEKRRLKQFEDNDRLVQSAQIIPARNELITCQVSSSIEVWDLATNKLKQRFDNESKDLFQVKIDQNDKSSADKFKLLWRTERNFKKDRSEVPLTDGFDLFDRKLFQPTRSQKIQKEDYNVSSYTIATFAKERKKVVLAKEENGRGIAAGKPFEIKENRHGTFVTEAALVTPNVALIGTNQGLYLFNPQTGREIKPLDQQFGGVHSISFARDHQYFTTYSVVDRTIAIWNIGQNKKEPQLFAKLMVVGDEWALVSPEGYFDCTPAAEKLFGWHVNGKEMEFASFHELDRFKDKYYSPALFDLLWPIGHMGRSLKALGIVSRKAGIRSNLGPKVSMIRPSKSTIAQKSPDVIPVTVGFEANGDEKPSAIALLINDRPHDRYYHEVEPGEKEHKFLVKLAHGKQEITAKAFSSSRKSAVSDRRLEIDFRPHDAQDAALGKLFFMGVGIDKFDDYSDLDFCRSDVKEIGKVFRTGSQGAFYEEPEIVTPNISNKTDFKKELDALLANEKGENEFGQTDTLVVMWSGHGDVDNENNFHLVMPECKQPTQINDKSLRSCGLSALEIARELRSLNGGHVILILDTCYSGKAVEQFRDSRGNLARQTNSEDFGIMVISASGATETSKENPAFNMSNFAFLLKTGLLGLNRYQVGSNKFTAQVNPLVSLDGQNIVTTHSLVEFLKKEMPGVSGSQTINTNGFGGRIRFLARRQ